MEDKELTLQDEEKFYVSIMRLNKGWPKREVYKDFSMGRLRLTFHWRSKKNLWGRFGGGWNWALGFEASKTCILLNLLIATFRVSWYKPRQALKTINGKED